MNARALLRHLGILIAFGAMSCSSSPPAQDTESHRSVVQTRLGQGLKVTGPEYAPKLLSRVPPQYPEEARQARTSGLVKLEALIDKSGKVVDVTILEGLPNGLSEAAAAAVRQWRFEPAVLEGKPVPVLFELVINFRLE